MRHRVNVSHISLKINELSMASYFTIPLRNVGNDEERKAMALYLEYAVRQQSEALYPNGVYTPGSQVQAVR